MSANDRESPWFQVKCKHCNPSRIWWKQSRKTKHLRCKVCKKLGDIVPSGEEEGRMVCRFICTGCDHLFHSVGRLEDTCPCYKCRQEEQPKANWIKGRSWGPPRRIKSKSGEKHTCLRCPEEGSCKNLEGLKEINPTEA